MTSQGWDDAIEALVLGQTIGVATADRSGAVLSSRGLFSSYLEPGACLWRDFSPLFNMEPEIASCITSGQELAVHQVGLPGENEGIIKANLKITWSSQSRTFLVAILRNETFPEHQAMIRHLRLQRVLQKALSPANASHANFALANEVTVGGTTTHRVVARRAPPGNALDLLTQREKQVVQMLGEGCSNKMIAHKLGISARTVEVYRAKAIKRLGLRTSAELMRLAIESGLSGFQ